MDALTGEQTIALADVRRITDRVSEHEVWTNRRIEAIREALACDVPVQRIAEASKLSRARIYQIRDNT